MTTAAALSRNRKATGTEAVGPGAIFTLAMDDHAVHCMTESMLDEWFRSLPPDEKAEIFDTHIDHDFHEMRLSLNEAMMRGSLADVVDRINEFTERFGCAFSNGDMPVVPAVAQTIAPEGRHE